MEGEKDQSQGTPIEKTPLTRRDFLMDAGIRLSGGLLISNNIADALNLSLHQSKSTKVPLEIILVETPQEAREIHRLISEGEPFERLAKERSIDPSAADGGYLGEMQISDLHREIRNALVRLHPGQVTGVIKTSSGYMIVKLLSETARLDIEAAERDKKLTAAALARVQILTTVGLVEIVKEFIDYEPKPLNWNQDLQMSCQIARQAFAHGFQAVQRRMDKLLKEGSNQTDPAALMHGYHLLAQLESYQGEMGKAIKDFQAAYQIAISVSSSDTQRDLEEKLAIAYLAQAKDENLVNTVHIESSLFPIRPEARYKVRDSVEKAIQHFRNCLQKEPSDLEVRWLLNLAYMDLGGYPASVPPQDLIPPKVFKSKEDIGRFVNIAPALGLNTVTMAGGVIVDDFDNDGFLDVVISCFGACTPMRYFHNNGDGTFTDRSVESGLSKQLGGLNLVQADYNNDGLLDILVLRGAWTAPKRNSLLRNNGDGTFTDVTHESGLAFPATSTQTAAWADFDNDGYIDLFIGNENSPSQLFKNKGNGAFVDVGPAAGIARTRFSRGVVAGDYDNDGFPDFYVSNADGTNFLYHNNGDGTFTDVAKKLHVELPLVSYPVWFFDYNNDGWLDLFVAGFCPSLVEVASSYLNLPLKGETLKLYKNTGKGGFQEVSKETGLNRVTIPMGANFGDVDNDGFLDFYLGTGAPSYGALLPNVLFRNHDGKYFVDITTSSGTGSLAKGHGTAFADINNDGDEELFIRMGGGIPGDKAAMLVFRNPGNGNNWITLRLVGVKTNRSAIGARIKVTVESSDHGHWSIHRVVGSGGTFGASPLRQHIGLGKAKGIERLEIWWPTSNTRQVFHNVGVNQFIEVQEFAKEFTVQQLHSFPL